MDPEKTQKLEKMTRPVRSIPMVCSWCGAIYRIERHVIGADTRTGASHGICPDCLEKIKGHMDKGNEEN